MDRKVFDSELGDIELYPDRIKRVERLGDWKKIESEFNEKELIDSVHFDEIEGLDKEPGSYYSVLKIKTGDNWRRMFFRENEKLEACFKHLKYRLTVYQQNH